MQTVENLQFDQLYSYAKAFFLLLYDHHQQLSRPIEIPHANILTCIKPFHNLSNCQQYLNKYSQKEITLFTTNNKIIDWNTNINVTHHKFDKLFIYCDTLTSHLAAIRWNENYHEPIGTIITIEKLDFHLLNVAAGHIRTVTDEFKDVPSLYDRFSSDGRQILQGMMDYFTIRATRLSEEVTK